MTELEKGTIKMNYMFYFCDKERGLYCEHKVKGCSKFISDDDLRKYQIELLFILDDLGNFEPCSYEEYVKNTDEGE